MKIAAVVVTYNRLNLLKDCINAIRNQTQKVDEIIVVNNSSTDGTLEWLEEQKDLTVITQENLGGAGGFYTGIKTAYEKGYDWIWCMDDDTIPQAKALEFLVKCDAINEKFTGFLSSVSIWIDGEIHKMNIPMFDRNNPAWLDYIFKNRIVPIKSTSFVSILINSYAVIECGLPIKEMFIWSDDVEYTLRISRKFKGFLVLDSIVLHKTNKNVGALKEYNSKEFNKIIYGYRNRFIVLRRMYEKENIKKIYYLLNDLKQVIRLAFKNKWEIRTIKFVLSGLFFKIPKIK